jgi:hypothetical protein
MRIPSDRMAKWQGNGQSCLPELVFHRDYEELNIAHEQLRVWLPHPAKLAMEAISERRGISMTAHLTEYFVSYLYGYYELLKMRETGTGLYAPDRSKKSMMNACTPEKSPNLGKNMFALKIFLPEKIKQGLQEQANKQQLSLGEFARALICAHLFGREYEPRKLMEISTHEKAVGHSWESVNDDQISL